MRNTLTILSVLAALLLFSSGAQAQTGGQFNPRDFSGIWLLDSGGGGIGPNNSRPALTPAGTAAMRGRTPARGENAVEPNLENDPEHECNPAGFPRLLTDSEPMEMMQLPDRLLQVFQWEARIRYLWIDGREAPSGGNLDNLGPAWYGHSAGRWEGDTLVVNTVGLEERAWLERTGLPKSFHARIEERYRKLDADTIELQLTLYDPEYYTGTWVGNKKIFKREPPETYTFSGWKGLFSGVTEGICAPMNEVDGYNRAFRDYSATGTR
jgi:hypothetical protein